MSIGIRGRVRVGDVWLFGLSSSRIMEASSLVAFPEGPTNEQLGGFTVYCPEEGEVREEGFAQFIKNTLCAGHFASALQTSSI